jgi:hypothetical protein
MKWNTLSVDGEMGCEDGFPCSICGGPEYDLIYFPSNWDCPEARRLLDWWNAHAGVSQLDLAHFAACADCYYSIKDMLAEKL